MKSKQFRRFLYISVFLYFAWISLAWANSFQYPDRNKEFEFPRDHGSHPEFRTEWWYLTGHFKDEKSRDYGFQLTFFRSASFSNEGELRQSYMAHAAIVEKETGIYRNLERFNKEGWNAGAAQGELDVYNGNWYLKMTEDESMRGRFSVPGIGVVTFQMQPEKPVVLFGDSGFSQKAEGEKNSSHYITYTRLGMEGEFRDEKGVSHAIHGQAWMDHEFSSSHLSKTQIGWDWASIQLDDNREIMVYSMRRKDGEMDPYSVLNEVDKRGKVRSFYGKKFQWDKLEFWENPDTGNTYPVSHRIEWKDEDGNDRLVILRAPVKSQEFIGKISGFHYWEGACDVLDRDGNLIGKAYVELTGYDGDLTF